MCAWYQVVASCAVYQNTVPKAKNSVVARRTTGSTGNRPMAHQQIATSIAARTVKMTWSLVARPHSATNGSRTTAGSGGNGSSARGTPSAVGIGSTSWKNALPRRPSLGATG